MVPIAGCVGLVNSVGICISFWFDLVLWVCWYWYSCVYLVLLVVGRLVFVSVYVWFVLDRCLVLLLVFGLLVLLCGFLVLGMCCCG